MEFSEVVRRRRMVRDFDPDRPVPAATVDRLLRQALRAPSAGFSQGWDFVVLTAERRDAFWHATTDPDRVADRWLTGVRAAPVLVVCCADPTRYRQRYAEPDKRRAQLPSDPADWPVAWWDTDTFGAALLLQLGAVDAGLGALFFGIPGERHEAVRDVLDIPADRHLVGVVALGHPTSGPGRTRRPRREPSEVVHYGRFGAP